MAYLKAIYESKCCKCAAKATVTLHNQQNSQTGEYCRRCGEKAVARLQTIEDKEFEAKEGA